MLKSILKTYNVTGTKEIHNNLAYNSIESLTDALNHLKAIPYYRNYTFEVIEAPEGTSNVYNLIECYLLNDNTLFFNINNGEIMDIYTGKIIKWECKKEQIQDKIIKRVEWNGWNYFDIV